MRVDRRLLTWGLFLILVGAVPLAVRQGILDEEVVAEWWRLWPLLIVAAGIGIVLGRTSLAIFGGLLTAATLGLMAGAVLAGGLSFAGCGGEQGGVAFPPREGRFSGTASVDLELNCGDLTVRASDADTWRIEGLDDDGEGPRIESGGDRLAVRSDERGRPFTFLGKRERWTVTLPAAPALDLDVILNAGRGSLELDGATLDGLTVGANAGDVALDLGDVAELGAFHLELNAGSARIVLPNVSFRGAMSVNAGTIRFCAPAGAGLRIATSSTVSSENFGAQGLTRSGDTWETADFESADVQIILDVEANAATLELNPSGGCNA